MQGEYQRADSRVSTFPMTPLAVCVRKHETFHPVMSQGANYTKKVRTLNADFRTLGIKKYQGK